MTAPAAVLPSAILGWVGGGAIKKSERKEEGSVRLCRRRGRGLGGAAAAGRRAVAGRPARVSGGAMSEQQFAMDSAVAAAGGSSAEPAEQPEGLAGAGAGGADGGGGGGIESEGAKIDASKNEEDEG